MPSLTEFGLSLALTTTLLAIAVIDAREMRIPDSLNALLFALGLCAAALTGRHTIAFSLFSAAVGFGVLWLVREVYQRLRGRPGLGLGDVKFAGAAGSWIGLEGLPTMILYACMVALAWVGLTRLSRLSMHATSPLPFGPFLAVGLWLAWMTGPV